MANGIEIIAWQGRGRLVRRFQEPVFQFRCQIQWFLLLLAKGANNIIGEFGSIRTNAATHLGLQEIFNVSSQGVCLPIHRFSNSATSTTASGKASGAAWLPKRKTILLP